MVEAGSSLDSAGASRASLFDKLTRIPAWLWIAILLGLAAGHAALWEYGADDVRFVRVYTEQHGDDLAVRWSRVFADFGSAWEGNRTLAYWRPLVSLSLAIDFEIFGLRPGVSAILNLLVHALSALCLFAVALRVLPGRRSAFLATLLFAATPLAHENIAWLVGRCGLTTLFGLGSGLALLVADERGWRNPWRHAPALALVACNLATMESAVAWSVFAPMCLVLRKAFWPNRVGAISWRSFVPYAAIVALYLGWRLLLFGAIAGNQAGTLLGGEFTAVLTRPFVLLHESIAPADVTFIQGGMGRNVFVVLCWLPLVVGLAAPLHFGDPRSRGYRRAVVALLAFWLLTRLPSLMVLDLGADLEGSRTAYYSYAPLALLSGLLAATSRYARWTALLVGVAFAVNLHHRISQRCEWAARGADARQSIVEAAEQRGAYGELRPGAKPLAILNRVDGEGGAPSYHPGEILYALHPPITDKRVIAVSVHPFARQDEPFDPFAGAWIAEELGGLWTIEEGARAQDPIRASWLDLTPLQRQVRTHPAPRIGSKVERLLPSLEVPGWVAKTEARLAVFLAAGPQNVRAELVLSAPQRALGARQDFVRVDWPEACQSALLDWIRTGYPGSALAVFVEERSEFGDASTAKARSRVAWWLAPR